MKSYQKICLASFILSFSLTSHAVNVVVNDPTTGQPLATQPQATSSSTAPTLAQATKPTEAQLTQANQQLLVQNAELQRRVDSLTTQNNVLVHERGGDLFVNGAYVAVFSLLVGFGLGWVVFGRKKAGW